MTGYAIHKTVPVRKREKRVHEVQSKERRAATYETIAVARVCVMRITKTERLEADYGKLNVSARPCTVFGTDLVNFLLLNV